MLIVNGVSKKFGSLQAVNDVSFEINKGECFGLLGPNGAGKTTTISMIVGLVEPDQGEITFEGQKITPTADAQKARIGYVPQELALLEELTALDNLLFFAGLYDLAPAEQAKKAAEVLGLIGLTDRQRNRVKTFSGGMKRRLNIGAALLHDPDFIVLDEPTVGVDPQSRNSIFDTLERLLSEGKTLLYTSHYMEEVERMCKRVAIMDNGQVMANASIHELLQRAKKHCELTINLLDWLPDDKLAALKTQPGIRAATATGNTLVVELEALDHDLPGVLTWLNSQRISYDALKTVEASLETVFLDLTGRTLRD